MKLEIIYIFHNCFCIIYNKKIFLFDYPELPSAYPNIEEKMLEIFDKVGSLITRQDLTCFVSRKHSDHFNPEIFSFEQFTKTCKYIISHDIIKKIQDFQIQSSVTPINPYKTLEFKDFKIKTLKSNNTGVAFIVTLNNINIYFGGDLVNSDFDNFPKEKKHMIKQTFTEQIEKLKDTTIHVAFSNIDKRLLNWAGAPDLIKQLKPAYFIPMHVGTNLHWVSDFKKSISAKMHKNKPEIFSYEKIGDTFTCEFT